MLAECRKPWRADLRNWTQPATRWLCDTSPATQSKRGNNKHQSSSRLLQKVLLALGHDGGMLRKDGQRGAYALPDLLVGTPWSQQGGSLGGEQASGSYHQTLAHLGHDPRKDSRILLQDAAGQDQVYESITQISVHTV